MAECVCTSSLTHKCKSWSAYRFLFQAHARRVPQARTVKVPECGWKVKLQCRREICACSSSKWLRPLSPNASTTKLKTPLPTLMGAPSDTVSCSCKTRGIPLGILCELTQTPVPRGNSRTEHDLRAEGE